MPSSARELLVQNRREVELVVKKNRLRRLTAFGSRVRGDANPDSDLDLTASFPPATSLFDMMRIQDELSQTFGRKVDLGSHPPEGSGLWARIDQEGELLVE